MILTGSKDFSSKDLNGPNHDIPIRTDFENLKKAATNKLFIFWGKNCLKP